MIIIILVILMFIDLYRRPSIPTVSASISGNSFFKKDGIEYVVVKDSNGNLSRIHADKFLAPTGTIVLWAGSTAPPGWGICNGSVTIPSDSDLRTLLSRTTTPNLGHYAVQGATSTNLNSKFGANTTELNNTHIPPHTHTLTWGGTNSNKFQPLPWAAYVNMESSEKCREVNDDGNDRKNAHGIGNNSSNLNFDGIPTVLLGTTIENNTSSTTTINIRQPSIILNYIIKF